MNAEWCENHWLFLIHNIHWYNTSKKMIMSCVWRHMCRMLTTTTNGKITTKRTKDSRYPIPISDMKLPNVVAAHGLEKSSLFFIQPLTRCLYFHTIGVPEIYKVWKDRTSSLVSFPFFLFVITFTCWSAWTKKISLLFLDAVATHYDPYSHSISFFIPHHSFVLQDHTMGCCQR